MKRILFLSSVVVVCSLIVSVTLVLSQTSPRRPFTLRLEEEYLGGKARGAVGQSILLAVRQDGSTAKEIRTSRDHAIPPIHEIIDVTKRVNIVIDHHAKVFDTVALSPGSVAYRSAPIRNSCEENFGVKCQTADPILNQTTFLVQIAPAGSGSVRRMWVAPALGWEPLKVEFYVDGQIASRMLAQELIRGEPDTALFEVPPGYHSSGGPDQFLRQSAESRGDMVTEPMLESVRARERWKREHAQSVADLWARLRDDFWSAVHR